MSDREGPKFFSVAEISNLLGFNRSGTDELICSNDCPFNEVRIGKRICVPVNRFYEWYESLAGGE